MKKGVLKGAYLSIYNSSFASGVNFSPVGYRIMTSFDGSRKLNVGDHIYYLLLVCVETVKQTFTSTLGVINPRLINRDKIV